MTATSGLPPEAAPTGGLLARHRMAIARFGTDVAAAGGIGPALAAGLDPADYPVVRSACMARPAQMTWFCTLKPAAADDLTAA